MVFKVVLKL